MRYVLLAVCALGLTTTPARAVDKAAINAAIDRGVEALKKMQREDGTWPHGFIGATALAGLTLLECDVPKSDRSVRRAAVAVRKEALRLTHTYSLSLAVLFLDKLDLAEDTPLIESMLVRLVAGQTKTGGWGYNCPSIADAEVRRLAALMEGRVLKGGNRDLSKLPSKGKRTARDLPQEIQAQLKQVGMGGGNDPAMNMGEDNSNTQFATLALWVGRRFGVPTQTALLRGEQRFRATQGTGGDWNYLPPRLALLMPGMDGSRASMTCAGMLGVACGLGARVDARKARNAKTVTVDISKDTALNKALKVLATAVGKPVGWDGKGAQPPAIPSATGKAYYFLWSLERVAVILNLETIGKNDWYNWGAEVLLANQRGGSWSGEYGECGADTCFALLFLKKVNLAHDLTSSLIGARDPGDRHLKLGGIGGDSLKGVKSRAKAFEAVGIGAKASAGKTGKEPDRRTDTRPPQPKKTRSPAEEAAARLTSGLLRARGERRAGILKELRDTRGAAYTEALAGVIPKLEAAQRPSAREALADRLTRMKPATLREYLKDADVEIRAAAALAAGQKDARTLAPDLIGLLDDSAALVRRAAQASLKEMAGKDLGPSASADASERKKAIAAWRAWWKNQSRE